MYLGYMTSVQHAGREDNLDGSYAIKFCVNRGKNAAETFDMIEYGILHEAGVNKFSGPRCFLDF